MRTYATVLDKNFIPGFLSLYHSLKKFNDLNCDFNIFVDKSISSDKSLSIGLMALDKKIKLIPINANIFNGISSLKKYEKAYYKFLVYTLKYDKILFLDSDLLVTGNIENLFCLNEDLHAVNELEIDQYNTGVMLINRPKIELFDQLLQEAKRTKSTPHGDQDIFNKLIKNNHPIPVWYNILKSYFRHIGSWLCETKIIHFIDKKPWQEFNPKLHLPGNLECLVLENLWHKNYLEAKNIYYNNL